MNLDRDYVSASEFLSVNILKVNLPEQTSNIYTAEAVALKLAVQYIQQQTLRKTKI